MISKVVTSAVLMCFWFTTTHAASVADTRIDALQEPYEKITLSPGPGDEATSNLFGDCLATSRTVDAKLASIEVAGSEYVRYVPDAAALTATNPTWAALTSPATASTVAECAAAAQIAGSKMFKYSGGTNCVVSTEQYDLTATTVCEASPQDAVFVLTV